MKPAAPRPLRILHVSEAFGGGVFEIVKTLAERLAAGGDTVAIAYGRRPETPEDVASQVDPAVELMALPWGERRSPFEQVGAARELRRLVAEWKPDVVHLHSSFAGVVGTTVLPRRLPKIYTPHGYSFTMADQSRARRLAYGGLERLTARGATLIGAVSEAEARTARTVAPARKVVVVHNGIPELDDLPESGPLPPLGEPPKAIALGRIDGARLPKQTAGILAAVSGLAEVAWVGGGGRGDIPPSVVTDQGVPVTGWVPRPEAQARLREAAICLHWTAWDGQPLSLLEAMANDVAVVARDIEPTREIVGERQVCRSEQEAIALMGRILTEPELRQELIQSQRRRRSAYGAQRMADAWQELYRRVDGASRP
jgi:glycosyltransferase involved in cell wall biosynthesis